MSITDELREIAAKTECANGRCEKLYRGDLEHIADRIDAEYQKAIRELNNIADASVLLPVDADGVPIRVGDVLTDGEYKFKVFELAAFGDGSWSIRNEDGDAWAACDVTHHHEPTVEDVLRDMLDSLNLDPTSHVDTGAVVAEYAAKLRLAGDAE